MICSLFYYIELLAFFSVWLKFIERSVIIMKTLNLVVFTFCVFLVNSIYEKLITYCGIDEKGTNYPLVSQ